MKKYSEIHPPGNPVISRRARWSQKILLGYIRYLGRSVFSINIYRFICRFLNWIMVYYSYNIFLGIFMTFFYFFNQINYIFKILQSTQEFLALHQRPLHRSPSTADGDHKLSDNHRRGGRNGDGTNVGGGGQTEWQWAIPEKNECRLETADGIGRWDVLGAAIVAQFFAATTPRTQKSLIHYPHFLAQNFHEMTRTLCWSQLCTKNMKISSFSNRFPYMVMIKK